MSADREQPRAERDVLAGLLPRQAIAVEALVHELERARGLLRELDRFHQTARRVVALLGPRALGGADADAERGQMVIAHLAEIVQVAGDGERCEIARVHADAFGDLAHQARDVRGMAAQVGAAALDQADEDLERLEVRLIGERVVAGGAAFSSCFSVSMRSWWARRPGRRPSIPRSRGCARTRPSCS